MNKILYFEEVIMFMLDFVNSVVKALNPIDHLYYLVNGQSQDLMGDLPTNYTVNASTLPVVNSFSFIAHLAEFNNTLNSTINNSVGQLVECVQPYVNSTAGWVNYQPQNFTQNGYDEHPLWKEFNSMTSKEVDQMMNWKYSDHDNMFLKIAEALPSKEKIVVGAFLMAIGATAVGTYLMNGKSENTLEEKIQIDTMSQGFAATIKKELEEIEKQFETEQAKLEKEQIRQSIMIFTENLSKNNHVQNKHTACKSVNINKNDYTFDEELVKLPPQSVALAFWESKNYQEKITFKKQCELKAQKQPLTDSIYKLWLQKENMDEKKLEQDPEHCYEMMAHKYALEAIGLTASGELPIDAKRQEQVIKNLDRLQVVIIDEETKTARLDFPSQKPKMG